VNGDHVTAFNEKPHNKYDRINGGYFVFEPKVFEFIRDNEDEILEKGPLSNLAKSDELMVYRHDGFWQPMDTLREYEKLNSMWNTGNAPWAIWEERAS
jgi:glucose-1-phosphate cytidylyltransferase